MAKIEKILKEVLEEVKIEKQEQEILEKEAESIKAKLKEILNKRKIKADVFLGGSLRKRTLIKKKKQDVDIFIRFSREEDISKFCDIIENNFAKRLRVHGSRDYYRIENKNITFEIVPVLKIKAPEYAKNSTDLSYFHVDYVLKKIEKNKFLEDDIILAKAFCHACNCYGAESHIKGFSGYALELLVIYYKGFMNFIKAAVKAKDISVIDAEKAYKNKEEILNSINEAKLESAIILIDPTFKERNVTAALSLETFERFQKYCREFLKKPRKDFFEKKEIDEKNLRKLAKNRKAEFVKILAGTLKQEGAIAGSKLLKFFNFLYRKFERDYEIIEKVFDYYEGKEARYYLVMKKRKEVVLQGPAVENAENLKKFKEVHKRVFIKNRAAYAKEKAIDFKDTLKDVLKKKIHESMEIIFAKVER